MSVISIEELLEVLGDARDVLLEECDALSVSEWRNLHQQWNLASMQACNGYLQHNLDAWSFEQTADYGRRIILYSRIDEYFQSVDLKDNEPGLYQEALQAAALLFSIEAKENIDRLGECELPEFKSILNDILLPHYLVYKFLEEMGVDA